MDALLISFIALEGKTTYPNFQRFEKARLWNF